jgi:choline dehydrogenase-like flavoprotein
VTLSPDNLRAFDLLVDTILPAVPGDGAAWTTPGADLRLSAGLPGVYEALPHECDRKGLVLFLRLLDSAVGGLVLFGGAAKSTDMAHKVFSSTIRPVRGVPGRGPVDDLMAGTDAVGYGPNQTSYLSFHQMGSARMGSDRATSVVDAENQTHDTAGLYVMDGSCFPTASGVNPMVSIPAIAHRGATRLAERIA